MQISESSHDSQSDTQFSEGQLREGQPREEQSQQEPVQSLTLFQMVGSILASFFGVQSGKNRERDFKHGKARAFIMVGILMTVVWYATIYLIVHVVLKR